MNGNSTRRVKVETGGTGVVAHVGLHAVGAFADRLGLGGALSGAIEWRGRGVPVHDRGKVLVQAALVLAGGGESCLDIEHLRAGRDLFGSVPSDTTVARTFAEITAEDRARVASALAPLRAEVWTRSKVPAEGPVVLDIDASLVEIHSENKEQTAPTFKGGFGFHPMFCFADATGETLAAVLRPGNAGANTVADHLTVLDQALVQLPDQISAGHACGDDPEMVERAVVVRADSAGCTEGFLTACRARNVGFFVIARSNAQVTAAIDDAEGLEQVWQTAIDLKGRARTDGAAVVELTSLIDDPKLPEGTRLIVRREPLHPGAQRSLFPALEFRYWGFYTDQDGDPIDLDATMRAHAHVEQHIERLKDSGLCRFPFTNFDANQAWLMTVALAADLLRWFQLLCLTGTWTNARPKTLRWAILHTPGRLVHRARQRIVRIADNWPTADVILDAYQRINLIS